MKKIIVLSLVLIMISLSACAPKSDSSTDYIPSTSDLEEITENKTATIGDILLSGKAHTEPFCNGYAIVCDDNSIYIINTLGEICVAMHNDTNFGQIISESRNLSRYNFYDGKAVFISKYGTISIPINNYNDSAHYYWPNSDEIEALAVTEDNLILVRETKESLDGSITTFGMQDYLGNWVVEPKEIGVGNDWGSECKAEYRGDGKFLIYQYYSYSSGGSRYYDYCLFNSNDGSYEFFGELGYGEGLPIDEKYVDGIKVVTKRNDNGVHFAVAIDENGNHLYEPIQLSGNTTAGEYSEGLVALKILEYNVEYIIYVDKEGKECVRFLAETSDSWYSDTHVCRNGIITDGYHYYDKNGNILFEQ